MKKLLSSFVIIIFSVAAFEIFLRYSPFSYGITPMEYDKDIGMWHKKSFSNYIIKECYKVKYFFDSYGRIKNNYDYNSSKEDIALLGDSQIEALMVENENVIHNSLYNELNAKYNVLNYGLSGTGPSQHLAVLKNKINLKTLDTLVHFVFLENDLNDGDPQNFNSTNRPKVHTKFVDLENYEVTKPKEYNLKEKMRDFLGHFELYVYLKRTYYHYSSLLFNLFKEQKIVKKTSQSDINRFVITNEEYKWKQLNGSIYQINKMAKLHNFKYKIVIFSTYEVEGYIEYRKKFESFLVKEKIEYINLFPLIEELSNKQKVDFKCDGHWNSQTHKEIARFLKNRLF